MRQRRNKTGGSSGDRGGSHRARARRRPPLPDYATVMGVSVQHAVGITLADLAERVTRVTAAAMELQQAIERGDTLLRDATMPVAEVLGAWAQQLAVIVQEGKPDWHPETVAWWTEAWHSPMSEHWLPVDKHALNRLAVLVEMFWRDPSKEILAEIRLQEQRFGLTWADRHRLGWKPTQTAPAKKASSTVNKAPAAGDPRQSLHVVKRDTA